ncbi:hypothetical protein SVTN_40235 (plasmid) [Streptomyces vietnamensis]|uniref:Uncharacterized protein n=1 Tax=Streptomyces vietnamensis TaxID=362257 RepID=A0A0B5IPR1_9ACTN|nr:hypothetical protein SVTN_40235 [Streptomyces vietnamensis]
MAVTDLVIGEVHPAVSHAPNDALLIKTTGHGMAAYPELCGDLLDLLPLDEIAPNDLLVR